MPKRKFTPKLAKHKSIKKKPARAKRTLPKYEDSGSDDEVAQESPDRENKGGSEKEVESKLKIISWNINGARACLERNGGIQKILKENADIICMQEVRATAEQLNVSTRESFQDYHMYWYTPTDKKGYAGVAVLSKEEPINVIFGLGLEEHDQEGRIITCEYNDFYLVNVYTPNSSRGLTRLDYKMRWDKDFREYLVALEKKKPVVACGDFNVAHREIDLANPKNNHKNAGFTPEERDDFTQLLVEGFVDSFRHLYPDKTGAYTWWSNFANSRAKNIGWRIDYFVISPKLLPKLKDNQIRGQVLGSDHCPIVLYIDI